MTIPILAGLLLLLIAVSIAFFRRLSRNATIELESANQKSPAPSPLPAANAYQTTILFLCVMGMIGSGIDLVKDSFSPMPQAFSVFVLLSSMALVALSLLARFARKGPRR